MLIINYKKNQLLVINYVYNQLFRCYTKSMMSRDENGISCSSRLMTQPNLGLTQFKLFS